MLLNRLRFIVFQFSIGDARVDPQRPLPRLDKFQFSIGDATEGVGHQAVVCSAFQFSIGDAAGASAARGRRSSTWFQFSIGDACRRRGLQSPETRLRFNSLLEMQLATPSCH